MSVLSPCRDPSPGIPVEWTRRPRRESPPPAPSRLRWGRKSLSQRTAFAQTHFKPSRHTDPMAPATKITPARRPTRHGQAAGAAGPGHTPLPWVADTFAGVAGVGLGVTLALVITGETRGSLAAPGGWLIAGGRLAGFLGAYLLLVMVVLISRLPWLERAVGQDRLVRWHRRIGPWPLWLITAHVVLITRLSGARQGGTAAPGLELHQLVSRSVDCRRRLRSPHHSRSHLDPDRPKTAEVRDVVDSPSLLVPGLGPRLRPSMVTGESFLGHPLTRAIWIGVWISAAGIVVVFRVVQPIGRSLQHQLRLPRSSRKRPVYSPWCAPVDASSDWRSQGGNPSSGDSSPRGSGGTRTYSLSALPRPPYLRVTVKGLGDQSRAVARLKPGTRVTIEGPYGAFTRHVRYSDRVALIGAGVGMTPLRALLEDLPESVSAGR